MKPQFVEIIVAIADCGSLGAASKRLGKTQPAITASLRKAESELGEKVFHRTPHGVVPTDLGQLVVERCRRIKDEIQKLDEEIAQRKDEFIGTVNIIAATSVASVRILPNAIKQYHRKYPKIRLNISADRQSLGFKSLLSGKADFVIGPAPNRKQMGGLKSHPLLETRIVVITGPNSKFKNVSDPKILKTGNWLVNGPVESQPRYFQYFEKRGVIPPEPVLSAESMLSLLELIEGSNDLCCLSQEVLDHIKVTNKFSVLPLEDEIGSTTISLTWAQDRPLTRAAILFSDIVCQIADNQK